MINLNINHPLYQELKNNPPTWWNNLKSDPEIYIDVRKDNSLNVYHNGGSIIKLEWDKGYKAKIHYKYIPYYSDKDYMSFNFQDGNIFIDEHKVEVIDIMNFSKESLKKIKKRINDFYEDESEKGIQGRYVTSNIHGPKSTNGFFIDTEFKYKDSRVDMIWVDFKNKKIALVELKLIGDRRLFENNNSREENIFNQLKKYWNFATDNRDSLVKYYNKVYLIKKELDILPKFIEEESLEKYDVIEKPILLVGDCPQAWIDNNADKLNEMIKKVAYGCCYHGKTNYNFSVPYKDSRNCFKLSTD